jgi:hypothetical protein
MLTRFAIATALATLLVLTACTPGMNAAVQSLQHAVKAARVDDHKLDPNFAYLRVTRGRHVGLFWLGSTEQNRDGLIEVYYSGSGEVLRIQNGRLVGASGLTTEWRDVEFVDAPRWSFVARSSEPVRFARIRDVMPGYRMGVRDDLVSGRMDPPSRTRLVGLEPGKLTWFEERFDVARGVRTGNRVPEVLPPTRYAVAIQGNTEIVVYAEQCLAPDFCFTWQRWSQAMQGAAASGVKAR